MRLQSAILLLSLSTIALATCCKKGKCTYFAWDGQKNRCTNWECADGKQVSGFECCGYRKCNIFCCNCDTTGDGKVCRVKQQRLLFSGEGTKKQGSEDDLTDEAMFSLADTDASGNMTFAEFVAYTGGLSDDKALRLKYNQHDKNGDGVLTLDEMRT